MKSSIVLTVALAFSVIGLRAQCTLFTAPGGSDANAGTLAAPFETPAHALQAATAGAVICLRGGTYPVTADLSITTPLTLQSYAGEQAVLSGVVGPSLGNIVGVFSSNVTLQNLEITGAAWYGIFVNVSAAGQPAANVHIRGCKVHNTGRIGIKAYESDSLVLEDSEVFATGTIDSNLGEGITVMAAIPAAGDPLNQGATVRRNYVHDVPSVGIFMKAATQRGVLEHNRVQRTGAGGIMVGGDSGPSYMRNGVAYECVDCSARNNLITDTQTLGLSCWAASNSRFYNNTLVNVAISLQAAFYAVPNTAGAPCTNATVENNVFVMSSTNRMIHIVNPGPGIYFDHNSYYSPTGLYKFWLESPAQYGYWDFAGWRLNTPNDPHSMGGKDPALDSSNGYQPGVGSPLIDAGMTLTEVVDDIAGTKRPQGPAYDIGAYEALPPDFTMTASAMRYAVVPGVPASYRVTLAAAGGFTGLVNFSVLGLPAGVTASFSPSSLVGSGSTVLTVDTTNATGMGLYPLTITGTGGGLAHSVAVTLSLINPRTPPTVDSVSPSAGTAASQTFTFKYSSPNGFGYLDSVAGLINSSISGAGACLFLYFAPADTLYLFNDAENGVAGTLTQGATTSIGNSQCTISGPGFTVSGSGYQLALTLSIASSNTFVGTKNVYGYAGDQGDLNSGWRTLGTWTPRGL